ncbi:MAG: transglycosylase domain-containing protein [Archangiaceae bacterium]|nr:transglycosylase domain-containing protein [Archangiaceae bacterium]
MVRSVKKWLKRLALALTVGVLLAVAGFVAAYTWFSRDLPDVDELHTWRPPQGTKVTCKGGAVCAEFYRERRTWVDVTRLPEHVKYAFLAAEDADFYQHAGLDYLGMARALLKALRPGSRAGGASTISQQACRNILLSQERTFGRKMREWILTPRMEKALSKDEILNLYVNTINFGHARYGVEEAAEFYFGKHARDLTLGEAAVLAGTVQLPERINPVTNVVKAKKRQRYVLGQLAKHGFVKQPLVDAELEKPILLGPRQPPEVGQYYAEEIRKQLVRRYGEERLQKLADPPRDSKERAEKVTELGERALNEGGYRIEIAMDVKLQAAAEAAVRAGLEAVDRRQGYRGALGHIDAARFKQLEPLLQARVSEAGRRKPDEVLIADLLTLKDMKPPEEPGEAEEAIDPEEPAPSTDQKLVNAVSVKPLAEGVETVGWVSDVDDVKGTALVDLVKQKAQLSFKELSWARPRDLKGHLGAAPARISQVVVPGDLVRVRLGKALPASTTLEAKLAQVPAVQGALLAIDPTDRTVVAMVGGYDFGTSAFNRATQAHRQPGSSFNPFLYACAMSEGKYTTLSVVNDAPFSVRDPYTGKQWKPQNYEKGGYDGPLTLRQALTESKNTVSVRLMEALTPPTVIEFARRAGIRSELPENLTLALGTGEVTMQEIANAYTTLQTGGLYADAVTLVKVTDARGTVLEEHHAAPEPAISPAVSFLITSLMRSVVEQGTATAVKELKRPAAGKTGTASEYRDAWFSGYTTDYVASAWVGFDDHEPLGPAETGGRAALPLWLEFMQAAHEGKPVRDFEAPAGVTLARVDPSTGLLAGRSMPGRVEPFLDGTAPTAEAPAPGTVRAEDFMLQDGKRGRP